MLEHARAATMEHGDNAAKGTPAFPKEQDNTGLRHEDEGNRGVKCRATIRVWRRKPSANVSPVKLPVMRRIGINWPM